MFIGGFILSSIWLFVWGALGVLGAGGASEASWKGVLAVLLVFGLIACAPMALVFLLAFVFNWHN